MTALFQAFEAWRDDPATRPALPIVATQAVEDRIDLQIKTPRNALRGSLRPDDITIAAEYDGETWDLLFTLDVCPQPVAGGFVCMTCQESDRRLFPTEEELWRDHLFDPFGKWIAEKVVGAEVLAFYELNNRGMTWAELHKDAEAAEGAAHVVPL